MRDPQRIVMVLQEIAIYWAKHPDLRLGQIISNAASRYGGDPFHMEEDELVMAIRGMECPACRDRDILSRCHHCGREGIDLKPKAIALPEGAYFCDTHKTVYFISTGCLLCGDGE